MKKYNFRAANPTILVLSIICLFIGISFFIACLILHNINLPIIIISFIGLGIFAFFFIKMTSTAKVEITLYEDALFIKWIERFLFGNKPNKKIFFNDIITYLIQKDSNWNWLKIEITDGSIFKIWQNTFFDKGNYSDFISNFLNYVKNYNNSIVEENTKEMTNNMPKIIRKKTIYETNGGLIMAGIAVLYIIGIPILLILTPPTTKTPNFFLFILGYIGALYLLIQVLLQRKKSKNLTE